MSGHSFTMITTPTDALGVRLECRAPLFGGFPLLPGSLAPARPQSWTMARRRLGPRVALPFNRGGQRHRGQHLPEQQYRAQHHPGRGYGGAAPEPRLGKGSAAWQSPQGPLASPGALTSANLWHSRRWGGQEKAHSSSSQGTGAVRCVHGVGDEDGHVGTGGRGERQRRGQHHLEQQYRRWASSSSSTAWSRRPPFSWASHRCAVGMKGWALCGKTES
jgi:hypothetical protein